MLILSAIRLKKHPCTQVIHAASSDGGHSETSVHKMVTKMLRHNDQEERQADGSRHWDNIMPTMLRAFARERAQDFADDDWLVLIHEGSNKMRMEYCKDSSGSLCSFTSYSRTLCWYSNKSRIDESHTCSLQLERAHQPQRKLVDFSIHFGEWDNSRRKRE